VIRDGRRQGVIQRDLERIGSCGQIKNQGYRISSHRPVIGKALVKGREMVHGEVRRYVDPMVSEQNEFNALAARLLKENVQRVEALEEKVEEINDLLHRLKATPRQCVDKVFELPYEPYGVGDTERCIEIPWALSCYRGEEMVLDVGFAHAEERFLKELLALGIPQLHGIDLVKKKMDKIDSVMGDIRSTPFRSGSFDLVLCISTIEHIGKDNSRYWKGSCEADNAGDIAAARELCRIMKNGGRIVLTAPYGMFRDYGWFIQYDEIRWQELIRASGCRVIREDFFKYDGGWRRCHKSALEDVLYQEKGAAAAVGLVCTLLEKSDH
jgi:O-antigen chain-terminating methyltransferase